jgi:colanic acid/amylovoran biosynthesis glycosyltransferase
MTHGLRLLVVASTFPARRGDGTPEFVMDLSLRLAGSFDTTILVPRVAGTERREQIEGVNIRRFAYFPRPWEDLADGAILENLRAKPSRWLQVLPFLVAETFQLRRLIRRSQPDVVHLHWVVPQGVAALLVARSVPWVVTTLGGDVYALNGRAARALKRWVFRRARAVTTMNADMRERVVALGADDSTTYVQSLGADINSIRQLARAGEKRVPGRILFVGRLVEKKGVSVLLDAVRLLPHDVPWTLEVVGDGPLGDELRAQAAGLPVTFSGAASREELANAYARSSVMVVPSVPAESGDQDGLPTVLLEAMGSGVAVVASDLPGLNEAVVDGETGLLVPPGDPDSLAKALRTVLTDDGLRSNLAEAAERRSGDYTIESCSRRFVEIVTAAAGAKGRTA